MFNIYNCAAIVQKIQRNKNESNLYQKVNQILKGAATGTADLINEVNLIIVKEAEETYASLENLKAKLGDEPEIKQYPEAPSFTEMIGRIDPNKKG